MYDASQFPIIIGVTGHRNIHPDAIPKVRAAVSNVLNEWRVRYGRSLFVLTALADGADQLVADAAREAEIPIIAVLPMHKEIYRRTITNKSNFDCHLQRSQPVLVLPDLEPAFVANYHERQYEQLGMFVARQSHLLLALWDGEQEPGNRAGTASVVRMRLMNEENLDMLRDSALFLGAGSQFRMTDAGPLLHIVTPRHSADPHDAGGCVLYDTRGPARQLQWNEPRGRPVDSTGSHAGLHMFTRRDFNQIYHLNMEMAQFSPIDQARFKNQLTYIELPELPDTAKCDADRLWRLQAATDVAAQGYQGRLNGQLVPARSWQHMFQKAHDIYKLGHRVPRLGAIFWLTAAVPAAVLCFEAFAHLEAGLAAYVPYMFALLGSYFYYQIKIADNTMQNRFQDYRALAEAMRVQLFWGLSTVRTSVSDHYLGKQIGELGWIQLALRGPALWSAALAQGLEQPPRPHVVAGWIENQREYFGNTAFLHSGIAKRSGLWAGWLLIMALVASVVLLTMELACADISLCGLDDHGSPGWWIKGILEVMVATFPVLSAFFKVSGELRAYEAHAHSYSQMRWIFARAAGAVGRIENLGNETLKNVAFRRLMHDLGREALAENAEWLVDHRRRPIGSELSGGGHQVSDRAPESEGNP